MYLPTLIFDHILSASESPWLLLIVIFLGVMVLEDATIAFVGVLASSHQIPVIEGLVVLIISIIISDSVAYTVGHLATRYNFAKRIVEHEHIARLRTMVQNRSGPTIFTTRFMPGFRFPMYAACGFFGVRYRRFVPVSAASVVVWVTSLFTISFIFGFYTLHLLGEWRWPLLVAVLLVFFFFAHRYWRTFTDVPKE